jgi:hypothetical protein
MRRAWDQMTKLVRNPDYECQVKDSTSVIGHGMGYTDAHTGLALGLLCPSSILHFLYSPRWTFRNFLLEYFFLLFVNVHMHYYSVYRLCPPFLSF